MWRTDTDQPSEGQLVSTPLGQLARCTMKAGLYTWSPPDPCKSNSPPSISLFFLIVTTAADPFSHLLKLDAFGLLAHSSLHTMDRPPLPTRRGPPIDVNKLYEASRYSPLPVRPDPEPEPLVSCLHDNLSRLAGPGNASDPITSPCTVEVCEGEPVAAGGFADSSAHYAADGQDGLADIFAVVRNDSELESDAGDLLQGSGKRKVSPSRDLANLDNTNNCVQRLPLSVEGELEAGLFEDDGPSSDPQGARLASSTSVRRHSKCRMMPSKIPEVPKSYQINVVRPDRQVRFAETIRLHAGAKRPRLHVVTEGTKTAAAERNGSIAAEARRAIQEVSNDQTASDDFSLDSEVSFDTVSLNSSASSSSSTLISADSDSNSSSSSLSDISLELPTNLVDYAPVSALSLGIDPRTVQIKQRSGPRYQPPRARPTSFFINSDSDDETSSSSSSEDEAAMEERRALLGSQRTKRYISRKVALGTAEQLQRWAQQTAAAQAAALQSDATGTQIDAPQRKQRERSRASGLYDDMQRSHPATNSNPLAQVGDRLYTYGPWPSARQDTQPRSAASLIIRPLSAFFEIAFCAIPLPFLPRLPAFPDVFAFARTMAPAPTPNVASSSRSSRADAASADGVRNDSSSSKRTCGSSVASAGKDAKGVQSRRSSVASSQRSNRSSSSSSGSSPPSQRIVTPPMPPTPVNIPVPDIIVTDYDQDAEANLLRQTVRAHMIAQGGKVQSLHSLARELRETYEPQRLERSRARMLSSPNYQGFNDVRHLSVPPARRRAPSNASRDARNEGSQGPSRAPAPDADVARGGLI